MPFVACSNLDGYRVSCVKFIKYYMCFYNNTMDFHKMRQNSAVGRSVASETARSCPWRSHVFETALRGHGP